MRLLWLALFSLVFWGCLANTPEVQSPDPVVDATTPAPAEDTSGNIAVNDPNPGLSMTAVLGERSIPDRVVNEGKMTIWVYETSGGEEFFAFQDGTFYGQKYVPSAEPPPPPQGKAP